MIGRVVNHEKQANYAFRETDFLPPGTRPGMVAGIPPGKRSYTLEVTKIKGIQSLKAGDRFDLLATLPVDDKLYRAVSDAYVAMYSLHVEAHYRSCDGGVGGADREAGEDGRRA